MAQVSVAAANGMLDNLTARVNTGTVKAYSGTVPANVAAGLGGATLLGTLTLNATAFAAATGGTATANAITDDSAADASGTPTFARITASDGTTVHIQCTAGVGSGELNFASAITANNVMRVTSLVLNGPV
jgi:hypothetical protein